MRPLVWLQMALLLLYDTGGQGGVLAITSCDISRDILLSPPKLRENVGKPDEDLSTINTLKQNLNIMTGHSVRTFSVNTLKTMFKLINLYSFLHFPAEEGRRKQVSIESV